MQTIRKRIGMLLVISCITSILFTAIFVNIVVNKTFNKYMIDIQNKRYERIIDYFKEAYKKENKWTKNSGLEMMHEAYMGNYCITLYDKNKNVIWGMDPKDVKYKEHLESMNVKSEGVYQEKTFKIIDKNNIVGYVTIGQYSSLLLSQEDINFKASINKSIVISSLIIIMIIVIISLYFSNQFYTPIQEISNISVHLSRGNLDVRSKNKSDILEIENLRNSINILGEKLKYQDKLRKRLISDISHEIRTPLNIVQNNLEAMIDGIFPITTERLNSLNEEVERFSKLLKNLNSLNEFEDESNMLNFSKLKLDEMIKVICKDVQASAFEKQIKLICDIKENEDYTLLGDKDKIKQVFINLLSNAVKFTETNGHIIVKLYKQNKKIIAEVIDDGIGIEDEDIKFIFERLYRGDKSRNKVEGSGIGLTIVKNILELHSAHIDIESKKGQGSRFIITFNKHM